MLKLWAGVLFCYLIIITTPAQSHVNGCSTEKSCNAMQANASLNNRFYLCELGALYKIPCSQVRQGFKDHYDRFIKTFKDPISANAPYTIEPKTHRIWLTSPEEPMEAPFDRLAFYNSSLQFYRDKPFEHHFWCNGVHLIPQTIATLKSFNVPIIIHDIQEIIGQFITKKLFQKLLNDKMFAFSSDLARQEIVLLNGGLYIDIGLEQVRDIESYFRKYQQIHYATADHWIDIGLIGAPKGAEFLKACLTLVKDLPKILQLIPSPASPLNLLGRGTWQLMIASETFRPVSLALLYENLDFKHHGLLSWRKKFSDFTVAYVLELEE